MGFQVTESWGLLMGFQVTESWGLLIGFQVTASSCLLMGFQVTESWIPLALGTGPLVGYIVSKSISAGTG